MSNALMSWILVQARDATHLGTLGFGCSITAARPAGEHRGDRELVTQHRSTDLL